MKEFQDQTYCEERALFSIGDAIIYNCTFKDGESPLKESKNINVQKCTFEWKYPLWYTTNVKVLNSTIRETARSGLWYIDTIELHDCLIEAPKTFRYSKNIFLHKSELTNAAETLWNCQNIKVFDVKAKGDYYGFHSQDIEVDNFRLDGNYAFDSAKNVTIRNSVLYSKDSFWNCENVTIVNCTIIGEYIGWNSKNVKLINCTIESHQGFCYMENVKLINCKLINSDLCFEYCKNIDADINSVVKSIKNPYSGRIVVKGVDELILDEQYIDKSKIKVLLKR